MPIWTTYLGYFRRLSSEYDIAVSEIGRRLKEVNGSFHGVIIYFVMRGRGNDAVAPSKELLFRSKQLAKEAKTDQEETAVWEQYKKEYLEQLEESTDAYSWMYERASEGKEFHVIFVCFERNSLRCHRRLLADYMVNNWQSDYRGELSNQIETMEAQEALAELDIAKGEEEEREASGEEPKPED